MGSLRDEVYENLDYLSQLTEVVIGPQNLVLGRAPDRWDLTFQDIDKVKANWWSSSGYDISIQKLLTNALPSADWVHINDIRKYFEFEVSDDFEIDFTNKKMSGTIALVKTTPQIEEKKILEIAINKATWLISHYEWSNKGLRDKVVAVLNTFEPNRGTEWAKKLDSRIGYSAQMELRNTLSHVILENKWRIRDADIILKVGEWVNSYLSDKDGTSHGFVNLLKLKMMLNKDLPVYSIDEVKHASP